jgi:hypothetical protein
MLHDRRSRAIDWWSAFWIVATHWGCADARPESAPAAVARHPADPDSYDEIDSATWRKVELELMDRGHGRVNMTLLRPMAWLDALGVEVGREIPVHLPEMGITGRAAVLAIEPCPPIEPGPADTRPVTGTFVTERAPVLDLYVEGLDEPIGVTPSHIVYSVGRAAWVPVAGLQPGELIRTAQGGTVAVRIELRPEPQTVYNLEIAATHTYFVSAADVWTHNECVPAFAKESARNFRAWARQFGNPHGSRLVGRGYIKEVTTEAQRLGFRNIRVELGGSRSRTWAGKWHINMRGPDGGRVLHLLCEEP